MRIDIVFDTICPWCFIGKRRMEAALEARPHIQSDISWHAFLLNPEMPAEGMEREDYMRLKFGGETRSRRVNNAISAAGRAAGISFEFGNIRRTPSTVDSHRLVRFADRHEKAGAAVEALYRAYFLNGQDIGHRSVLFQIGDRLGLDVDQLRTYIYSDLDIDDIGEQNARAHRLGISGVPAFIIDGELSISGAQEPAVFHRIFDVAEEMRRELMVEGTQPV